jgi:hypothetical protein
MQLHVNRDTIEWAFRFILYLPEIRGIRNNDQSGGDFTPAAKSIATLKST